MGMKSTAFAMYEHAMAEQWDLFLMEAYESSYLKSNGIKTIHPDDRIVYMGWGPTAYTYFYNWQLPWGKAKCLLTNPSLRHFKEENGQPACESSDVKEVTHLTDTGEVHSLEREPDMEEDET